MPVQLALIAVFNTAVHVRSGLLQVPGKRNGGQVIVWPTLFLQSRCFDQRRRACLVCRSHRKAWHEQLRRHLRNEHGLPLVPWVHADTVAMSRAKLWPSGPTATDLNLYLAHMRRMQGNAEKRSTRRGDLNPSFLIDEDIERILSVSAFSSYGSFSFLLDYICSPAIFFIIVHMYLY